MLKPPATFYGVVLPRPDFTPAAGMRVTASMGDTICNQTETHELHGQVVYSVKVQADGPGTAAGCGAPGRTVHFEVDMRPMASAATWDNNRVQEALLRPPEKRRVFLPLHPPEGALSEAMMSRQFEVSDRCAGRALVVTVMTVCVLLLIARAAEPAGSAANTVPAAYYGPGLAGPDFAPTPGMQVTAFIDGHVCGRTWTQLVDNQLVYSIKVSPDGPGGITGCGDTGRMIAFEVAAVRMERSGHYHSR